MRKISKKIRLKSGDTKLFSKKVYKMNEGFLEKKKLRYGDLIRTKTAPYSGNLFLIVKNGKKLVAKDILDTQLSFELTAIYFVDYKYFGNISDS